MRLEQNPMTLGFENAPAMTHLPKEHKQMMRTSDIYNQESGHGALGSTGVSFTTMGIRLSIRLLISCATGALALSKGFSFGSLPPGDLLSSGVSLSSTNPLTNLTISSAQPTLLRNPPSP